MLVPIGSWCRTAYQVNKLKEENNIPKTSFPFDWTITSYRSLQITLGNDFSADRVLNEDSLRISRAGSVLDEYTNLIHHHDLSPKLIAERSLTSAINRHGIPVGILKSDEMTKARGRFLHTYENLARLRQADQRIGFVRWNRFGHPDRSFPDVFENESRENLYELLSRFLQSESCFILQVVTMITDKMENEKDVIRAWDRDKYGASAVIAERRGFDGNGKHDFRGDSVSWRRVLERFCNEFEITLGT